MSTTGRWMALAGLMCVALGGASAATSVEAPEEQQDPYFKSPEWLGQRYLGYEQYDKLDELVERLVASDERAEDGRPQLYKLTKGLNDWLELWDEGQDTGFAYNFSQWRQQNPKSAFLPIAEAMQVHATAWRARGHGFASSVTPEGWALFKERNQQAWQMIMAAKKGSSRIPSWYQEAIAIGLDADVPQGEVEALFHEGIRRFPGFFPLYFSYARQFSPRWGGDYVTADAFINAQVKSKTNPDGEALYARLYWLLDQTSGADPDFFTESRVEWGRMRTGFEMLMKQYPAGAWNQANFVAFACRAGDGNTYLKWRKTADAGQFLQAAPGGVTFEVCDARFLRKT